MSTIDLVQELGSSVRGVTRREYAAMIELGLLVDEKVELLRGMIVEMAAKASP